MKQIWPVSLAIAALLLLAVRLAYGFETYGSTAGDYSVNFPAHPEESVHNGANFRIVSHAVNTGGVVYIATHGDFAEPVKAEIELDANISNYVNEIRGVHLTSSGPLAFARGDRQLPAKQFAYDGERASGRGIVVVDGKSSYLVAAAVPKPIHREAEVDKFLASFKLAPPK